MADEAMMKPSLRRQPGAGSKSILRALLEPSDPDTGPWTAADLRSILRHQLEAPLAAESEQLAKLTGEGRAGVIGEIIEGCGCRTFAEILQRRPPFEPALRMFKDYAKGALRDGLLPEDVARVLYFACIQCGRRAGIRDITSLDPAAIERGVRRCLTFGWLPDEAGEWLRGPLRGNN